jgi:hypothetical protein
VSTTATPSSSPTESVYGVFETWDDLVPDPGPTMPAPPEPAEGSGWPCLVHWVWYWDGWEGYWLQYVVTASDAPANTDCTP